MRRLLLLSLLLAFFASPALAADPFRGKTDEEIVEQIDAAVAEKKGSDKFGAALAGILSNSEAGIRPRERAAWAIGELNYRGANDALLKAAKHKGLLIRSAALGSLARLRPDAALPVFVSVAESDPILSLRQRATIALGLYRSEKAIDPLVKLSSDPSSEIRGSAALAMAMTHSRQSDFTEILAEMAEDEDPYVRERAGHGLDLAKGRKPETLAGLSASDADIRLASALALERVAGESDLGRMKEALAGEADGDVRAQLERSVIKTSARVKAAKEKVEAERKAKAAEAAKAKEAAGEEKPAPKAGTKKTGTKKPAAKTPAKTQPK